MKQFTCQALVALAALASATPLSSAHAGQLFPPANIGANAAVSCPNGEVLSWIVTAPSTGPVVNCTDPTPGVTITSCPVNTVLIGINAGAPVCAVTGWQKIYSNDGSGNAQGSYVLQNLVNAVQSGAEVRIVRSAQPDPPPPNPPDTDTDIVWTRGQTCSTVSASTTLVTCGVSPSANDGHLVAWKVKTNGAVAWVIVTKRNASATPPDDTADEESGISPSGTIPNAYIDWYVRY